MYDVIQLSDPFKDQKFLESFTMDIFEEEYDQDADDAQIFSEAVFSGGKAKIQPLEDVMNAIHDKLHEEIKQQTESDEGKMRDKDGKPIHTKFNPVSFWRDPLFKDLENKLKEIFGFRHVVIEPYIETYDSKNKIFSTRQMNASVYRSDRFPIDGLVTDAGFYDKTHSINMTVRMTLGLIKDLSGAELLGVLLHEFGHTIDPALMTISYTDTNILSKYLTDRKKSLTPAENKALKSRDKKTSFISTLASAIKEGIAISKAKFRSSLLGSIMGKKKSNDKGMDKLRTAIRSDEKFTRQNFAEAFADNFARMYGYAVPLASGLEKLTRETDRIIKSRLQKEKEREEYILAMIEGSLKDVHRTDIHRVRALINEYKADIKDPNTPAEVKKQLQDDLTELEKVLDKFLNDYDDFTNKVHQLINEELEKAEGTQKDSVAEDKPIKESTETSDENIKLKIFGKEYKLDIKIQLPYNSKTASDKQIDDLNLFKSIKQEELNKIEKSATEYILNDDWMKDFLDKPLTSKTIKNPSEYLKPKKILVKRPDDKGAIIIGIPCDYKFGGGHELVITFNGNKFSRITSQDEFY